MTQENSKKKWSANAEKSESDPGQALGAYLQRERQKKQLTIKEVADATRIPPETLQALESGNRNILPVSVFTRGFVKIYAAHLGLDQAEILERFSNEWGRVENATPEILSGESMAESSPFFLSFRFYFLLFLVALLLSLAYFFFQADDTPSPAALTTVPFSMDLTEEQVVVKNQEVTQVKIIPTSPAQDTLLISPQSAGKVTLEDDNTDQEAEMMSTARTANAEVQPTVPSPTREKSPAAKSILETSSAQIASAPKKPEPTIKQSQPSSFPSVNLHIRFLKRTRISVAQDDRRPDEFIFAPGEESSWQATNQITLQIDDSDSVEMTLNGSPISVNDGNDGPLAITLPQDLYH